MNKYYKAFKQDAVLNLDVDGFIKKSILSFESYLKAVSQAFEDCYDLYIDNLIEQLPKGQDLHSSYKSYMMSLLEHKGDTVTADSFHKMRLLPQYLRLECLVDIVGRTAAVNFTRAYLDQMIFKLPKRQDAPKSINQLRIMQVDFNIQGGDMDWIGIRLNDQAYCNIVTKCRICDIFKTYDSELIELLACYPDFAMFKAINPHFVLTRDQTLIGGGIYCDACYHDDRLDFKHPSPGWIKKQMSDYLQMF
ncbi:hypothetical protein EZV73_02895 [Acidaminobacter sp. JC074]|uniref:L-2-amino-thiazoline-4-carboxylic acid hydrolase n=1 Tax=Acidaminobacter sp. JC074 TaxID=2530199 RepID=UPI001F0FEAFA|nr:L-2-amino-thiazoline-4-carboxylic acid hydrolase [Acidaminobacter sp. JC074]MCH4886495.1 hypothetical protein [Acidaminobacter sp. JC074]